MSEQSSKDWQRLARLVVHRRVRLGYRLQKDFTDASGIKIRTLNNIENARQSGYDAGTIAMLEQALQWDAGSVEVVLTGGDPVVVPDQSEPAATTPLDIEKLSAMEATLEALLAEVREMRGRVDSSGLLPDPEGPSPPIRF